MNKTRITWNRLLSRIIGITAEWKLPPFLQQPINKAIVAIFKIDLSEHEPISHYASVNALFTRPFVRPRNIDTSADSLIAPTDATLIASGIVRDNQALQIKGISYSVSALLAQSLEPHEQQSIEGMRFFNLYLSPRDYHRFHAPTDLRIVSIAYCDGNLSSVHPSILCKSPVFVSNERVILRALDSRDQPLFFVAVGALNVGKILIYAEPKIHTNATHGATIYHYNEPISIQKAQELGQFKMGSSIVLLAKAHCCVQDNMPVRFGQCIGSLGDDYDDTTRNHHPQK